MADPSPNPSRPGGDLVGRGSWSDGGRGPLRFTAPPSEPRSSHGSFEALDAQVDRPAARFQMIVALVLGLVLVAIPLYLWRRPRAESIAVTSGVEADALPAVTAAVSAGPEEKLVLGDVKIVSCHDSAPKRIAPEQCDRVVDLEKAFAKAIEESSSCVPRDAGGGTIVYVADVGFKKGVASVSTPKEERTLKSSKVASTCEKAIKIRLAALPFESMKHEHARYRVSIRATYPGSIAP